MGTKTLTAADLDLGEEIVFAFGDEERQGVVDARGSGAVGVSVATMGSRLWLLPDHPVRLAP